MNKSLTKRVRFTKNGKMVRRPMAVNHFRTRSSGRSIQQKRKSRGLDFPIKTLLNY